MPTWQDHTRVEVWLAPGTRYDHDALAAIVGSSFTNLFALCLAKLWNRHRPKDSDVAMGEFAMFENVCGMVTHCWPDFASQSIVRPQSQSAT